MKIYGTRQVSTIRVSLVTMLVFALSACSNYYKDHPDEIDEKNSEPFVLGKTAGTAPSKRTARATKNSAKRTANQGSVVVEKGQTVYALSRAYNVPVRDIIAANNLRAPYVLRIGQTIQIPGRKYYIVKRGDTGSAIARMYGVQLSDLMRQNNIRSPYRLAVGQKLALPGGAVYRQVASNTKPPVSKPSGSKTTTPPKSSPKVGNKTYTPPPRTSSRFSWPVNGKVISSYGMKSNMQKNEGINIAAKQGSPVRSAEDGVVVYASNALESYGNLLLIKHADGWLTAYAHNERLLVSEGQNVSKGQVIARVGNTGSVKTPQLHFEVRKGRTTFDPQKYLVTQTAATTR